MFILHVGMLRVLTGWVDRTDSIGLDHANNRYDTNNTADSKKRAYAPFCAFVELKSHDHGDRKKKKQPICDDVDRAQHHDCLDGGERVSIFLVCRLEARRDIPRPNFTHLLLLGPSVHKALTGMHCKIYTSGCMMPSATTNAANPKSVGTQPRVR